MNSVWSATAQNEGFPQLNEDIKTQVVIVGGGLAGVMCLKELSERGVDCVLLEAKSIGSGTTKNTTAKVTFQHGLVYNKLIKTYGTEKTQQYLSANKTALQKIREMSKNISCDFEEKDAYIYSADDTEKIYDEIRAYESLGVKADFIDKIPLPVECAGAVKIAGQGQFNPLKFLFGVAKGLKIYENSKVLEFMPNKVRCEKGSVTAQKIIVATHFPILNKHGGYSFKLYQDRSYVVAIDSPENINGMYLEDNGQSLSFRNYKNLLLVGGGGHRTGKNSEGYRIAEDFCRQNYPDKEIKYRFATQDCMSLDHIPYIGKYSDFSEDIYVATGFNKWGITSSVVAADVLSDMVTGVENPCEDVFAPSRSVFHPKLFANVFHSVCGLITPTTPRCPHLGCALKYNKEEHSWDCPCHGSRFTEDGELIDNPATDDLKKHPTED